MNQTLINALNEIKELDNETLKMQLEMVKIPAPTFDEYNKGSYVLDKMRSIGLTDVYRDEVGNIFGVLKGYDSLNTKSIFLAAHLDTVFPIDTELTVKKEGNRYYCPGISDNTRAIAEILTIAKAMVDNDLRCKGDIIFCANVCEEGLGDLKGVKHFFKNQENQKKIGAFISLDNDYTGAIISVATGSKRYEVTFFGPGGHSFGAFGTPNPIHAMGRAIAKIADIEVPKTPKTTFNVGVVEGGTSVNTIANKAVMLMDIRSNNEKEIELVSEKFFEIIDTAVKEENNRWLKDDFTKEPVYANIKQIGHRPAGMLDIKSDLVQTAIYANEALGIESILDISSSTDANLPISLGIPSVTLGRGGKGGGTHTLNEWFENDEAYLGPQRDLILLIKLSEKL